MDAQARPSPPAEPIAFAPDPAVELPASAEVVVVGAGMVGASAAYRLALAGMRPLVIEANGPASGASGRLAGMALSGLGSHFSRVTRLVQAAGGRSITDYTSRSLDLLEALDTELPGGSLGIAAGRSTCSAPRRRRPTDGRWPRSRPPRASTCG